MQRLKIFLERLPLGYLAVCDDGTLVNDLNFDNCPGNMLQIHNDLKQEV